MFDNHVNLLSHKLQLKKGTSKSKKAEPVQNQQYYLCIGESLEDLGKQHVNNGFGLDICI